MTRRFRQDSSLFEGVKELKCRAAAVSLPYCDNPGFSETGFFPYFRASGAGCRDTSESNAFSADHAIGVEYSGR
jgi:hypothetical protein